MCERLGVTILSMCIMWKQKDRLHSIKVDLRCRKVNYIGEEPVRRTEVDENQNVLK